MNILEVILFCTMIVETCRRTLWCILRIENEFFNNYEGYRKIPTIPMLIDESDKQNVN